MRFDTIPVSMIEHGDLELLAQAEVPYQRTALGLFDTMQRSFLCHSAAALRYMQRVFQPGKTDAETVRIADASERGFREMLVVSMDPERQIGEQTMIRVNYEGLLYPKAAAVQHVATSEEQAAIPVGGDVFIPVRLITPVPTVVHRWVTTRGKPPVNTVVGTARRPPGLSAKELDSIAYYYDAFLGPQYVWFRGWTLDARTPRSPGDVIKSQLWEVTDVYRYTVIRVPTPGGGG